MLNPFTKDAELKFWEYIHNKNNRYRLSLEQYDSYRGWLSNPQLVTNSPKDRNDKYTAKTFYYLSGTNLYRRSTGSGVPPRRVVQEFQVFDYIKQVHTQINHKGKHNTYNAIKEQFYGIKKDKLEFLLSYCQICALNRPSRSRAP